MTFDFVVVFVGGDIDSAKSVIIALIGIYNWLFGEMEIVLCADFDVVEMLSFLIDVEWERVRERVG